MHIVGAWEPPLKFQMEGGWPSERWDSDMPLPYTIILLQLQSISGICKIFYAVGRSLLCSELEVVPLANQSMEVKIPGEFAR